ncbi:Fur family transcriptional regulator [Streptomyces massasporeus]|uniref:Fur family transcriptional regulator n=1 Tax=Streptomyces massasporeus TaxID=67324 RepID=UPI0037A73842
MPWRRTRQRKAVLSALHDCAGFTSARELHEALEADGIPIGLTTVYRALHALDRSGQVDVVREKSPGSAVGRYAAYSAAAQRTVLPALRSP